jgi:hypothetical protein
MHDASLREGAEMTDENVVAAGERTVADDESQGDATIPSADVDADTAGEESVKSAHAAAEAQQGGDSVDSGDRTVRGTDLTLEPGTGESIEAPFKGGNGGG